MGAGAQLLMSYVTVLFLIYFCLENQDWRPHLWEMGLSVLAIFGFLNGYQTSRYLRCYGTTDWVYSAAVSGFILPTLVVIVVMVESLVSWLDNAPLRHSFGSGLIRIILWYTVNGTMCYIGSYFGYQSKNRPLPVEVNRMARPIPDQPYANNLLF